MPIGAPPAPHGGYLSQACRAAAQDRADSGGDSARAPALSSGALKGSSVPFGCATWCGIVVEGGGGCVQDRPKHKCPAVTTPTHRPGGMYSGPQWAVCPFEQRSTPTSGLRRTSATSPPYSQPLSPQRHGHTPSPSPHFSDHVPYHSPSASRRAPADGVTQRPRAHCCASASVPRIRRLPIIAVCAHTLFCVRVTWQWHSALPCGTVGRGFTKGQQQRVVCVCVCVCGCVCV